MRSLTLTFASAFSFACHVLPVHAQETPAPASFLNKCDDKHITQECLDQAWAYADLVQDERLTLAELARLARSFGPARTLSINFPVAQDMMTLSNKAVPYQLAQQALSENDFDGDGTLSKQEFFGEVDPNLPSPLRYMMEIDRLFRDINAQMNADQQGALAQEPVAEAGEDVGRGLDIVDVEPARDVKNGVEYLIVQGTVVNISSKEVEVPDVTVQLRTSDNHVVASQTVQMDQTLGRTDKVPFMVEFANPPSNARQMDVTFTPPQQ